MRNIQKPSPDRWLSPIALDEAGAAPGPQPAGSMGVAARCSNKGFLPASLDDYLQLLDWTGRQIAPGKAGAIPSQAPPILSRLAIDPADWLTLTCNFGRLFARIAGRKQTATRERTLRSARRFRRGQAELLGV